MPRPKQRIKGVRELKKKLKVTEGKTAVLSPSQTQQQVSFVRPGMLTRMRPRLRRLEEALPDTVPQRKQQEAERPRTDEPSPNTPFSYETSKGGESANGLYRIPGVPGTSPGQGYQAGTINQAGGQTYQTGRETPPSSDQSLRRAPDTTRTDPFKSASPFDKPQDNRYETAERKYDTSSQKDREKKQRVL